MDKTKHISNNLIISWVSGEIDDQKETALIEDHMDQCDRCFQLMTDFSISHNELADFIIETEEGEIVVDVKTSVTEENALQRMKRYIKHYVTDPAPPQPAFGRLIPVVVVSLLLGFFIVSISLNNTYTYSLQERVIRTSELAAPPSLKAPAKNAPAKKAAAAKLAAEKANPESEIEILGPDKVSSNKPDVFIESEVLKVVFEVLPVDVTIKIQSLNGEFLHKEILSQDNLVYSFELWQLIDNETDFDLIIYDKEKNLLYDGKIIKD